MTTTLRAIGIIIGILLIVSPAFGEAIDVETINIDIDDASVSSNIYEFEGDHAVSATAATYLLARNVESIQAPFALILHANVITQDAVEYADLVPIRLSSLGITYGYGTMGYQAFPDGTGYIWLEIESYECPQGVSGSKTFNIVGAGGLSCRIIADPYNAARLPQGPPFAFAGESSFADAFSGIYTYNAFNEFKQKIAVTYSNETDKYNIDNIAVARVVDGKPYRSTVEISAKSGVYHESTSLDAPISINISSLERPYQINVFGHATELWYNKTVLSGPDPPDVPSGGFALALSPASVQVGETVTATLTAGADAPDYSYLVWSATPDDHPDMATWSYRIQDVNGTWYERAANGDEIPISAADAHTYQATPAYPGGHHIGVTVYDHHPPCQGLEQRATLAKPFEALYKSGSSPVRIQVVDERTGALIAGSNIQVIDSQLPPFEGTGINPIINTTLPQGSEMFYLQRNAYDEPRYRIFADADGYRQVTENQWFSVNPPAPNTVTTVTVQMAATVAPPEDPNNAFVTFRIRDEDGNPVREARVTLDRWTRHALGTRPVTFEVPRGATYQYTVEPIDPGLYPATGSVTVGEEDSYEVNVVLSRTPGPGDDPGATPPPRDTRTNEEKGKAVIDLLADNAELIATLAILAAVMGLINLIVPGRRRR